MYTREEYEAKRTARLEKLQAAAARAAAQAEQITSEAGKMAEVIPFGQPILIGHHSEKRDRNYRSRIENKYRRGYELYQKSKHYESRAASAEDNNVIYTDDPDAPAKLREKIKAAEELQERYKALNAAYRKFKKNPASLDASTLTEAEKDVIRKFNPTWSGDSPAPKYLLQNNNANIKRMRDRLQQVEKKHAAKDETYEKHGIKIVSCPSENRIRIFYPGKPEAETRSELKRNGYRWTPSLGCWQAYHNYNAMKYAKSIITMLDKYPPELVNDDPQPEQPQPADPEPRTLAGQPEQPEKQPALF